MPDVAIAGSTGRVGSRVARLLSEAAVPTRLLVRDPRRTPDLPHTEVVRAEYGNVPQSVAALEDIDTAFMVSIHDSVDRTVEHHDFVDAAVQAGVRQMVYLSLVGAGEQATSFIGRHHGDTEAYLATSGLAPTVLRANYLTETLEDFLREDVFYAPVADGRVAAVARDDVAAAIAAVVADPHSHVGQVYELSGPQALNFHEIAEVFTAVYGDRFRFVGETEDEARASRVDYHAPPDVLEDWLSVYQAIRHGVHGHVTGDVWRLTGREPTSVLEALSRPPD